MTEQVRYRFGPRDQRGVLLGWRCGQIAVAVGGSAVALVFLRALPGVAGLAAAGAVLLAALGLAWWPVGGRTAEQWVPAFVAWLTQPRGAGSGSLGAGLDVVEVPTSPSSTALSRVLSSGSTFGAVRRRGDRTLTAVLALRPSDFALSDEGEKDQRVARWSSVLASLAGDGSHLCRIQWTATTVPDDGRPLWSDFGRRAALDASAPARRSYAGLLTAFTASLVRHRVLVALCVPSGIRRAPKDRHGRASGVDGSSALVRQVGTLVAALEEADMPVEAVLDAAELSGVVRASWTARPTSRGGAWPTATAATWRCLRTESTWHATYWVAEWPRTDVGPEFLSPLLVDDQRRTVAMVMEPVDPARATRLAQRARTTEAADAELRRRGGYMNSARRVRQQELVARREVELADGHAAYRFAAFVTVTADDAAALDEACQSTEQTAGRVGIELRRLNGEQESGYLATLPLCCGLR